MRHAANWREDGDIHIDVRGLPPPGPLLAILRLIDAGDHVAIVVHHDRDPLLLYPELAERGWTAQRIPAPDGEVQLRLEPPS
ncbi:MAG: DUF2249 domain-containing protein [Betaproteobacteria bacterium]